MLECEQSSCTPHLARVAAFVPSFESQRVWPEHQDLKMHAELCLAQQLCSDVPVLAVVV